MNNADKKPAAESKGKKIPSCYKRDGDNTNDSKLKLNLPKLVQQESVCYWSILLVMITLRK